MVQEYKVEVDDDRTVWRNMEGQKHRLDGPAIERGDGSKEWWVNGQLHRLDGHAIEWSEGYKAWWINGNRHREDGPAVEFSDGSKEWWVNGNRHREDGPAIEWCNGSKAWWVNGKQLTEEEFNRFNRKVNPVKELTIEEISNRLGYEVKVIKS